MGSNSGTTILDGLVDSPAEGERHVADEIRSQAAARLLVLTRRMLRNDRVLRRSQHTSAAFHASALRFWAELPFEPGASLIEYWERAARQIRLALIELATTLVDPTVDTSNSPTTNLPEAPSGGSQAGLRPRTVGEWRAFHETTARLAGTESQVFSLVYYAGWPPRTAAEQLGVTEALVLRHWLSAVLFLRLLLSGDRSSIASSAP